MSEIPNWFYRTSIKALILDENKKFNIKKITCEIYITEKNQKN